MSPHESFLRAKESLVANRGTLLNLTIDDAYSATKQAFFHHAQLSLGSIGASVGYIDSVFRRAGAQGLAGEAVIVERNVFSAAADMIKDYDFIIFGARLVGTIWKASQAVAHQYAQMTNIIELSNTGHISNMKHDAKLIIPAAEFDLDFPDVVLFSHSRFANIDVQIFTSAMRWIAHHEMAHIWNGHLGYRRSTFYPSDSEQRRLVDITLEIDADFRAVGGCMMDLFSPWMLRNLKYCPSAEMRAIKLEMMQQFQLIGITLALFVSCAAEIKSDPLTRQHPPASVRLAWITEAFRKQIPKALSGTLASMSSDIAFALVCDTIEQSYSSDWQHLIADEKDNWTDEDVRNVRSTWNYIRLDLIKFARGFQMPGEWRNNRLVGWTRKDDIDAEALGEQAMQIAMDDARPYLFPETNL